MRYPLRYRVIWWQGRESNPLSLGYEPSNRPVVPHLHPLMGHRGSTEPPYGPSHSRPEPGPDASLVSHAPPTPDPVSLSDRYAQPIGFSFYPGPKPCPLREATPEAYQSRAENYRKSVGGLSLPLTAQGGGTSPPVGPALMPCHSARLPWTRICALP